MYDDLELSLDNLDRLLTEHQEWIPVKVSSEAMDWINAQALQRHEYSKMNGWKSKTGGSSLPYDIPGVAGEWAGHHVFGIKFNYHAKPTTRAELNTGDLFDQKRNIIIEIKTNRYVKPGWDLIENKEKLDKFQRNRDRPYVNCLTGLLPNYVLVIGWAWGHEIMKGRVHRHLTAGHEIYILSWKKLRPPMSLHQELGLPVPEWLKNW